MRGRRRAAAAGRPAFRALRLAQVEAAYAAAQRPCGDRGRASRWVGALAMPPQESPRTDRRDWPVAPGKRDRRLPGEAGSMSSGSTPTRRGRRARRGRPPVSEPGLAELLERNAARLRFTSDPASSRRPRAWVTFDTPVDEEDNADVEWVLSSGGVARAAARASARDRLLSAAGRQRRPALQARCAPSRGDGGLRFACVPENLRLGSALECFRAPDRIVAGVRSEEDRARARPSCWRRSAPRCNGCGSSRRR